MLNFEKLPTEKPSNLPTVTAGEKKAATVYKTQMLKGKTSGVEYLNVSFKLAEGGFVNENYFDSDKPFVQYKLSRLLNACKVALSGEGTLKDVAKVIMNKNVLIDVAINDNGYPAVDYTNNHEGVYPATTETVTNNIDPEVNEAIEESFSDEDF